MNVSYTSLLTVVMTTSILTILLSIVISFIGRTMYIDPRYILLPAILLVIKCFLPCEFFYTITLASKKILPSFQRIMQVNMPFINISIFKLAVIIWVLGIFLKLIILTYKEYKMALEISKFPVSEYTDILTRITKEKGISKKISLLEIPGIASPALVGIRNAKIIIPNNLAQKDLYYILLHEVEHFKSKDMYFIMFLQLVCIIYWWNPIFYILKINVQRLIELRVDRMITIDMAEEKKLDYLQSLINVAKLQKQKNIKFSLGWGFYEKQSELSRRLYNVLNSDNIRYGYFLSGGLVILILLSSAVVVEPYSIKSEYAQGTFDIPENSYIIEKDGLYEVYLNGKYYFTLDNINRLESLPQYISKEIKK